MRGPSGPKALANESSGALRVANSYGVAVDTEATPTASPEQEQPGPFVWLQGWYTGLCDGDWEHGQGISISTIDNPGWSVKIDLELTPCEGRSYERAELDRGVHDWHHTWVNQNAFHAACGPLNLGEVLHLFRTWVQAEQ